MKKFLSIILTVVMVLSSLTVVLADDGIKITIDGEAKNFDVMPQIIDGRTLVPMRAIFESLGAEVGWDDVTKTATGKTEKVTVSLTIDKKAAKVNNKVVALDVPAQIVEGRTMVPARFVAESLGCKVDWDGNTKTVIISKDAGTPAETPTEEVKELKPVEGSKLAVVSFEDKTPAPASGINFWGKDAEGKNLNSLFTYVNWSDVASIGKPNSDDDFGSTLVKIDSSMAKVPAVSGIYDGRVNDIAKEIVNFKIGNTYTLYVWVYLAETTTGGNTAKMTLSAYANDKAYGFKTSKAVNLKVGEWTRVDFEFKVGAEQAGATTGARISFGAASEGEFAKVVYLDNITFVGDAEGTSAPVVAEPEKKEEAKQGVAADLGKILDATLPQSGTVIATQADLLAAANGKSHKDIGGGVFQVTIAEKPEKDTSYALSCKSSLENYIKKGNVYMLTFKARLVSGSPYIKAFIQANADGGFSKPIFALTKYGSDWTTCYMPFVGNDKVMNGGWGFRFGGAAHVSEIKELQLIDYGTSVKIEDLPHTYDTTAASVNGLKFN